MFLPRHFRLAVISVICLSFLSSGCAVNFYKQSKRDRNKIKELKDQISDLEKQREMERERFREVERTLTKRLRDEIADEQISLKMTDSGLVIILSDNILFDSGKAQIKAGAKPVLDKVAQVIKTQVPDKNIGISGHTDNVPIKYSGWESNWELSSARATNVLHYLLEMGVSPDRLSAIGYGEHRPIASNGTSAGRAKNRRVEIVILPEFVEERVEGGVSGIEDNIK